MCVCWWRLCAASHVSCSILYIIVGAIQLIAGIFFLISLPVFKIGSNLWTGVWNVIVGVGGAVFSCVGDLNPDKHRILLYLTISVLALNVVNLVILEIGEWGLLMPDSIKAAIQKPNLQTLVLYARMTTTISTAVAAVISFLDAQFMFCWLEQNMRPRNPLDHNETVSDIEYIIPRVKSGSLGKNNSHNICQQYTQSWVFDTGTVGSSHSDSPYSKLQQFNGSKAVVVKHKRKDCNSNAQQPNKEPAPKTAQRPQPMVLVEDTAANERQLVGSTMTSFSRTPSPDLTKCISPRPHSVVVTDQVQYASLMVELEAALQQIQDLESPITAETPSEGHDFSISGGDSLPNDSRQTSKLFGEDPTSFHPDTSEITCVDHSRSSDTTVQQHGVDLYNHACDGDPDLSVLQSRKDRFAPAYSAQNLSNNEYSINRTFRIKNELASTFILSETNSRSNDSAVNVSMNNTLEDIDCKRVTNNNNTSISSVDEFDVSPHNNTYTIKDGEAKYIALTETPPRSSKSDSKRTGWKSFFKKKSNQLVLTPELESAILKSESLCHLSDVELVERYKRDKSVQRKLEEKAWQKISGSFNSDSSC